MAEAALNKAAVNTGGARVMDAVFEEPLRGGRILVGGQAAAHTPAAELAAHGITSVVNCTVEDEDPRHSGEIRYLRFAITRWPQRGTDAVLATFLRPLLRFVDKALARGESVLVHCRAGAHRAGTTGVLLVMYRCMCDRHEALRRCRTARSIIDPSVWNLSHLLRAYQRTRAGNVSGFDEHDEYQNGERAAAAPAARLQITLRTWPLGDGTAPRGVGLRVLCSCVAVGPRYQRSEMAPAPPVARELTSAAPLASVVHTGPHVQLERPRTDPVAVN
jgi:predicted protein tyrosine phosphatase